jgi:hypothetical protein
MTFDIDGIGNTDQAYISAEFYLDGVKIDDYNATLAVPKGNAVENVRLDPAGDLVFDEVLVRFTYADPAESTRTSNFRLEQAGEIPDRDFDFRLAATDGDGDIVSTTVDVGVDGNGDGVITFA